MDYQPQTVSAEEMNTHLESMLGEIRAIQNAVNLSIDEIDHAFTAAIQKMEQIESELENEYKALEDADTETEAEVTALVLARIDEQTRDSI